MKRVRKFERPVNGIILRISMVTFLDFTRSKIQGGHVIEKENRMIVTDKNMENISDNLQILSRDTMWE